ncbi:MAG: AIR synthase-related protein, partial [Ktedonobacterales bacterium]
RKVFEHDDLNAHVLELGRSLGDELLQPHRGYLATVRPLVDAGLVTGMAHITGGGLVDNLPRVVPERYAVALDAQTWDVLPIFRLIQARGAISWDEMARVFNLGLGFVLCCRASDLPAVLARTREAGGRQVGTVRERADGEPRVIVEGLA